VSSPEVSDATGRRSVVAAFVAHATAFGVLAAFASLLRPIAVSAGVGRSMAAVIASLPLGVLLLLSRRAGGLADSIGSRRVFALGGLMAAAALAACSASPTNAYVLVGLGLPLGVGAGGLFVPSLRLVESSVPARVRARSIGLAATGAAFGSLVLPPCAWLVADHDSLRWALAALAGVALTGAAVASAVGTAPPPRPAGDAKGAGLGRLRLVSLTASCAFYIPVTHLAAAAQDSGASVPLVLVAVGAANAAGRLAASALRVRTGRLTLLVGTVGLTLSLLLLALSTASSVGVTLSAVVYGLAAGVFVVELPTLALEADQREPGRIIGSMYQPMSAGAVAGPVLAGVSFEHWGGYGPGLLVAAVGSVASTMILLRSQ
jgi:OFA family oxalate/formate antiporter-like MFS transporter